MFESLKAIAALYSQLSEHLAAPPINDPLDADDELWIHNDSNRDAAGTQRAAAAGGSR